VKKMQDELIDTIVQAGTAGVEQGELFAGKSGGNVALALTNTLAKLRRDGVVVLRRETRNGQDVRIYYSAGNEPALPSGGGAD
jgi:hypothetical protein